MKMSGKYPRGKLNSEDEGTLDIRMAMKDGTFIVHFGKPVVWIGMSKEEAYNFARIIMQHVVDEVITLDIPEKKP